MTVSVASSVLSPTPLFRRVPPPPLLLSPTSCSRIAIHYILLPSFLALSSHRSATYYHPRTLPPRASLLLAYSDQHIGTVAGPRVSERKREGRCIRKDRERSTERRRDREEEITWEGEKEGTKKSREEMSKMEEQGDRV